MKKKAQKSLKRKDNKRYFFIFPSYRKVSIVTFLNVIKTHKTTLPHSEEIAQPRVDTQPLTCKQISSLA